MAFRGSIWCRDRDPRKVALELASRVGHASSTKRYGALPHGTKSARSTAASGMLTYTVPHPVGAKSVERVTKTLVELTTTVEARLEALRTYKCQRDSVNFDPHKAVPGIITQLRDVIDQGIRIVDDPTTRPTPVADGALPPCHPVANTLTWALGALSRCTARVEESMQANAAAAGGGLPSATPEHHRAVEAVMQMLVDLPHAQALYADTMRMRLAAPLRRKAFSSEPWVTLPEDLPLLQQGQYAIIDEARASPAALKRTLFLPEECRSAYHELLAEVRETLDGDGIRHWATGGTLLGAMRHGDMIPWDDDVDLCVCPGPAESAATFESRLRELFHFPYRLEAAPLFGYKVYSNKALSAEAREHAVFGVFVDLFVMAPSRAPSAVPIDLAGAAGDAPQDADALRPLSLAYPDAEVTWPFERWQPSDLVPPMDARFGPQTRFRVPGGAEQYLSRAYGPDWARECVVPKSAHGRTMASELRFSRDFAEKAASAC